MREGHRENFQPPQETKLSKEKEAELEKIAEMLYNDTEAMIRLFQAADAGEVSKYELRGRVLDKFVERRKLIMKLAGAPPGWYIRFLDKKQGIEDWDDDDDTVDA